MQSVPESFPVGVGVIVLRANPDYRKRLFKQVLLLKRGDKWEGPGGTVERGESPYQAAVRELYEEVGLVAHNAELVGANKIDLGTENERVIFSYLVRDSDTTEKVLDHFVPICRETEIHSQARWIDLKSIVDGSVVSEIPDFELMPYTRVALASLRFGMIDLIRDAGAEKALHEKKEAIYLLQSSFQRYAGMFVDKD